MAQFRGKAMRLVERVAREFLDRHGSDAPLILREHAEIADGLGDRLSAEAWRDIADAVERLIGMKAARRAPPVRASGSAC
jgi:hypothetical protein